MEHPATHVTATWPGEGQDSERGEPVSNPMVSNKDTETGFLKEGHHSFRCHQVLNRTRR